MPDGHSLAVAASLKLVVRTGEDRDVEVGLDELPVSLGSDPACTLRLPAPGVQPVHGVVDLDEAGTLVYRPTAGGRPVPLAEGVRFRIGPCQSRVESRGSEAGARLDANRPLEALLRALPRLWEETDPSGPLLDALREGFGASWGAILVRSGRGWKTLRTSGDRHQGEGDRVSRTVLGRLEEGRGPILTTDVHADPQLSAAVSIPPEVRSVIATRIAIPEGPDAALYLESPQTRRTWSEAESLMLDHLGTLAGVHLEKARASRALEAETRRLGELHRRERSREATELLGSSPGMKELRAELDKAAATDVTVLILGETGTGKELVARSLHERSCRSREPFVAVNCAAIPAALAESELFGHEPGAFTGATQARLGRFELAQGGTLFLDELADLPGELQPKLLRVLENRTIERLGGQGSRPVDVRLVAATHGDLAAKVEAGTFRADLFYRFSVFVLRVPPLRSRLADIPELADRFVALFNRREGRQLAGLDEEALAVLASHHWPGNVRELRNVVEQASVRAAGDRITAGDLLFAPAVKGSDDGPDDYDSARRAFEIRLFTRILRATGGDTAAAAARLGLSRSQVYKRVEELGLDLRVLKRG